MPHRLAMLTLAFAFPAMAQDAPSMAGPYHLEGVMETGSELALHPDGRFQWYLIYGALDLFAEGKWRQADGAVTLTSEKSKDFPDPPFDHVAFAIRDGKLIPPDGRGAYVRSRPRNAEGED